jgi:hypothetical protein
VKLPGRALIDVIVVRPAVGGVISAAFVLHEDFADGFTDPSTAQVFRRCPVGFQRILTGPMAHDCKT